MGLPGIDQMIAQLNYCVQIIGNPLSATGGPLTPLILTGYDESPGNFCHGALDPSDYAQERAARGTGKPLSHPDITFAMFLALIFRTLMAESQFSQAAKVLTILKLLNNQLITVEEAKIRFTNIRPFIKT